MEGAQAGERKYKLPEDQVEMYTERFVSIGINLACVCLHDRERARERERESERALETEDEGEGGVGEAGERESKSVSASVSVIVCARARVCVRVGVDEYAIIGFQFSAQQFLPTYTPRFWLVSYCPAWHTQFLIYSLLSL